MKTTRTILSIEFLRAKRYKPKTNSDIHTPIKIKISNWVLRLLMAEESNADLYKQSMLLLRSKLKTALIKIENWMWWNRRKARTTILMRNPDKKRYSHLYEWIVLSLRILGLNNSMTIISSNKEVTTPNRQEMINDHASTRLKAMLRYLQHSKRTFWSN